MLQSATVVVCTALIQSRGRARTKDSKLIWFCANRATGDSEVRCLLQQEQYTLEAARKLVRDEADVVRRLELLWRHGARKFMTDDAVRVLGEYLGRAPDLRTVKAPVSIPNTYLSTIKGLRPGEGLPDEVQGEPRRGVPAAEAAAAYRACVMLHEQGRLLAKGIAGDRFTLLQLAHALARHQALGGDDVAKWAADAAAGAAPRTGATGNANGKAQLNEWAQKHGVLLPKTVFTEGAAGHAAKISFEWQGASLAAESGVHAKKKQAEADACGQVIAQLDELA